MATIQLGRTKAGSRLISYAEKKAEKQEGVNCPPEYAKAQMSATRQLWGKPDGVQAHHIIQSFKPGEVSASQANEVGQELAREMAKGHEAVVYTHTDKEHIHNHIVINSVHPENGMKYQAHGRKAIDQVREASDRICKERDLSVVEEKSAELRYTRAEKGLIEKNEYSWKDDIRDKIDVEKTNSTSFADFKKNLLEKHGVQVKERGKNITFVHPEKERKVRGSRLGNLYEKESIKNEFEKRNGKEIERGQDRGTTAISNEYRQSSGGIARVAEGNERAERSDEKLHPHEHGQRHSRTADVRQRDRHDQDHQQERHRSDVLDFGKARQAVADKRRSVAKGFERFTNRDEPQQSNRPAGTQRDQQKSEQRDHGHEQKEHGKPERAVSKDRKLDFER